MVSRIYRLAQPEVTHISQDEARVRLRRQIKRLVAAYGEEEVLRKLREAQVPKEHEITRAWVVLEVLGAGR